MRGDTVMNLPTPGYGNVEVNNSGASNSGNTSGGLKKPLIIIAAILGVVIIGATAYFMFSSLNSTDSTKDNSELANEIAPYLPDYTTDEIKEILDTELSQEQQEYSDQLAGSMGISDPESVTMDEDGTLTYIDGNGNTVVDESAQDVINMSDEELKAESDRIDEYLQSLINGDFSNVDTSKIEPEDPEKDNAVDNSQTLDELAESVQQGREDMGYSGGGVGGQLTDSDADWVSGQMQVEQ